MRRPLVLPAVLLMTTSVLVGCGSSGEDVSLTDDSVETTSTTAEPDDSSTASTTTSDPTDGALTFWPPADEGPALDAAALALDFAERYLGIAGDLQVDDPGQTEGPTSVGVRRGDAGAVTVVELAGNTTDGWQVTGARAETIAVDAPAAEATITSPLALSGQANAFEGTVVVQVRPAGSTEALGETFVTGATGELAPFEGEVPFEGATSGEVAAVVFYAPDESGEGTAITATVVPVRFA